MKKLPLPLPPLLKIKIFLMFLTIYLEKKLPYLILRSGKFGNLVTSFFFINNTMSGVESRNSERTHIFADKMFF